MPSLCSGYFYGSHLVVFRDVTNRRMMCAAEPKLPKQIQIQTKQNKKAAERHGEMAAGYSYPRGKGPRRELVSSRDPQTRKDGRPNIS